MVKVIKLKIARPINVDWKTFSYIVKDIDYNAYKIKNEAMTKLHFLKMKELDYNANNEKKMNAATRKELYGYSTYTSLIYQELLDKFKKLGYHSEINGGLLRQTDQAHQKVFLDMLKGNAVLPTFKRGGAMPIRARSIKVIDKETLALTVLSKNFLDREDVKKAGYNIPLRGSSPVPITVSVRSKKNYANLPLQRILDGRYKLCDSQFKVDGNDCYILLTIEDLAPEHHALDPDKILGVDLGVSKAAVMAVGGSQKFATIEGGEITAFRKRIEKQRVSKRNQFRYASENRRGHGRKTLMKPLDHLSNKIENYKNATNHRYARNIVDYAIKNGCGSIQLEDLSKINQDNTFLATWSYYDLQTKIEEKAKMAGILTNKIKPNYTSQPCNRCGNIDKESRVTQELFKCTSCGHTKNADVNAAQNIAMFNIETIIAAQLKVQNKVKR